MIVRDDGQMMLDKIEEAKQKPGFSLPAYFFNSAVVYQSDLDKIIYKSWLYACHVSEIPEKGDFVTVKIDNSSVIITRDKEGGINALMNSCRHRGSVVCREGKCQILYLSLPCLGIQYTRQIGWRSRNAQGF